MKKGLSVRIWGFFETLAFLGVYYAAAYIARFLMYLFYMIYFAISHIINNEIFKDEIFTGEINGALAASGIETIILADIIMIVLCAGIIYARGGRFKKYVALRKTSPLSLVYSFIAGAGIWYVSSILLMYILSGTQAMAEYGEHMTVFVVSSPLAVFVLTAIVAPITEEIMFRGALFNSITRLANKSVAIIATSILFGIAHGDPVHIVYAMALGFMLALLRSETGKLWPCIMLHLSFNLMNYFITSAFVPLWLGVVVAVVFYALALKKDCK